MQHACKMAWRDLARRLRQLQAHLTAAHGLAIALRYFTYSSNLLAASSAPRSVEEQRLRHNVQHTIRVHSSLHARLIQDPQCQNALLHFGRNGVAASDIDEYNAAWQDQAVDEIRAIDARGPTFPRSALLAWRLHVMFSQETRGPVKADICRGAFLFNTGGYYMDVDLVARVSVLSVMRPGTDFITARMQRAALRHALRPTELPR